MWATAPVRRGASFLEFKSPGTIRGENTARRSRNQTCTYHTLAGIVGEGNISARLATNLGISSTEGTEATEKKILEEEVIQLWVFSEFSVSSVVKICFTSLNLYSPPQHLQGVRLFPQ